MSGRARVRLPDGRFTTYRKTLRRRAAPRPVIDRAHELNERCVRRFPTTWVHDVRVGFFLPRAIQPFVSSGPHGGGVNVIHGFVQVRHGSFEECCVTAEHFFYEVARDRPAFTVTASVISKQSERRFGRYLSVVNGAMVVSGGLVEPKIYQA